MYEKTMVLHATILLTLASAWSPTPDLEWTHTSSKGETVTFFATIPPNPDFKDLNGSFAACLEKNMSLVTVSTIEEQENIFNSLNEHLSKHDRHPVAYWISLSRSAKTEPMMWRYQSIENVETCELQEPVFWIENPPDEYSALNCVNMLFNFDKNTGREMYNWQADLCDQNYNGGQGAAHGYICSTKSFVDYCIEEEVDPDTDIDSDKDGDGDNNNNNGTDWEEDVDNATESPALKLSLLLVVVSQIK